MTKPKRRDPKKGTGKKPKGTGRRLYTDENPKDTVKIKFATPADARATVAKVKKIKNVYMIKCPNRARVQVLSGEKDKKMIPATLLEANRRLRQVPLVCAISICLDGYETAYPDVAIECGLMPNSSGIWQTGASHIAHSVILSYRNPNPKKTNVDCGVLTRNKTDMACCSRGNVVQMRNELRASPTRAYQT